jgi:hypothetical protein
MHSQMAIIAGKLLVLEPEGFCLRRQRRKVGGDKATEKAKEVRVGHRAAGTRICLGSSPACRRGGGAAVIFASSETQLLSWPLLSRPNLLRELHFTKPQGLLDSCTKTCRLCSWALLAWSCARVTAATSSLISPSALPRP